MGGNSIQPTASVEAVRPDAEAEAFIQAAVDRAPEPLRRLGEWLAGVLDEDDWKTAERMLLGAAIAPETPCTGWKLVPVEPTKAMLDAAYAAHDAYDDRPEPKAWCGLADAYRAMLAASLTAPTQGANIDALVGQVEDVVLVDWFRHTSDPEESRRVVVRAVVSRMLKLSEPVSGSHPDDIAVERFAAVMKAKLTKKRAEGRGGWEDKEDCSNAFLSQLLREHVGKGDPVDVGNLAMMIHQRGERITHD